ncbi:MAG: diguanylate cyclase [Pseudomonadota bacterium]
MTQFLERRSFIKHASAANAERKGVLLLLDGDNFSAVTDKWGPVAHELAIQAVEEAICSNVREFDVVSYLEGNRFVVFVNNATLTEGGRIAERIRKALARMTFEPKANVRHTLTVSIGGVIVPPKMDMSDQISWADTCLKQAKTNGRNNVVMKTYLRTSAPLAA